MWEIRCHFLTELHNVFLNSVTVCHYEANFMTCSILSLNNVGAGLWRWDGAQILGKGLDGVGTNNMFCFQLAHLSSSFIED